MRCALWGSCLWLAACSRSTPPEPSPRQAAPAHSANLVREPEPALHASGRLVAIGDLHGDLENTRKVLQLAGAIGAGDHWTGDKLTVVQTGDTIDRGDDDRAVIDLIERLRGEAASAGGAFVAMSGNHELMNVAGDFRYVTAKSAAQFEPDRAHAFAPGGPYARVLANWPVIARVDDSVFVHGGVLWPHVQYGIAQLNRDTAAWMRGEAPLSALMQREDAPVWTRLYSSEPDPLACEELERVLEALHARRMVVGHTPQAHGITSACDGRVWRIDTGLSHHYGGPLQVLELIAGQVQVRASQ
jgi:hypothetical protein